ncbi:MAG: hypothetical protein KDC54_10515 [Lewinella sp.]|nr:hypothetical protein [Lewinella sp.]
MKPILLILSCLTPVLLAAQGATALNKYAVGMEIGIGHSFPNFDQEQTRWQGTFYPAGAINLSITNQLTARWIAEVGVGITGYALTNRGSVDKYVLDFASPTISAGLSHHFLNPQGQGNFIKLTTGLQLGYQGSFTDEFDTYRVRITGSRSLYPFIRPEIGIRRYFKHRMRGSRFKIAYEFGTFFRYNLSTLGTATIEEPDFAVTLAPRGNIIGAYVRLLLPAGNRRVRSQPERPSELPPIIYHPRYQR